MPEGMDANTNGDCQHKPPLVIIDATGTGHRIRCLGCDATGPVREYSGRAWADLDNWRHEEANLSRQKTPLY
jgi:hypothetical protein